MTKGGRGRRCDGGGERERYLWRMVLKKGGSVMVGQGKEDIKDILEGREGQMDRTTGVVSISVFSILSVGYH